METNFFSQISALQGSGNWKINISFLEGGQMLVSVLLEKAGNEKPLAPIVFGGTAGELDGGFFGAMKTPAEQTAEFFASLDAHQLSVEKAKSELKEKAEKKPASTPAPKAEDKNERKKRYDGIIEKAKKLNTEMKYAEALELLPSNEDFPEKSEELDGLRAKLEERKAQKEKMSLFA